MILVKKNDILKDLSDEIFASPNVDNNVVQPATEEQIFKQEDQQDIFLSDSNNDVVKVEENKQEEIVVDNNVETTTNNIDFSIQNNDSELKVVKDNDFVAFEFPTFEEPKINTPQEINFDEINKKLEEAIEDSNKEEVNFNTLTSENIMREEPKEENISLNDINTIIEEHFSDVNNVDNTSLNDIVEESINDDKSSIDDAFYDYEDEDITFNDLNNMTQEFNLDELNAVLAELDKEDIVEEEKNEEFSEEEILEIKEEIEEVEETRVESNFPKLDKFGSVFPRKSLN